MEEYYKIEDTDDIESDSELKELECDPPIEWVPKPKETETERKISCNEPLMCKR